MLVRIRENRKRRLEAKLYRLERNMSCYIECNKSCSEKIMRLRKKLGLGVYSKNRKVVV